MLCILKMSDTVKRTPPLRCESYINIKYVWFYLRAGGGIRTHELLRDMITNHGQLATLLHQHEDGYSTFQPLPFIELS